MTITAATRPATATLQDWPIQTAYKRRAGLYVARLAGEDPKYGVARDFAKGRPVKSRKVIEYGPGDIGADNLPAWILRRPDEPCGHCGQTRPTRDTGEEVIAGYSSGWTLVGRVFGSVDLLAIHAAGPPGSDGAWDGRTCVTCDVSPVFADGTVCHDCPTVDEVARLETAKAAAAGLEEPF